MPASPPERRRAFAAAAAVALALMFAVVAASAYIRLSLAADASALLPVARGVHRAAATLTALAVLVLAVLAWRSPGLRARAGIAAGAALLLTLALSALGVATGTTPPAPAQFANLYGGLLLLALLAWLGVDAPPDLDGLARRADGWSGAEIAEAVRRAALGAIARLLDGDAEPDPAALRVTAADLQNAMDDVRPPAGGTLTPGPSPRGRGE